MTTAKHRALDHLRRAKILIDKHEETSRDLEAQEVLIAPDSINALDAARADKIGNDMLRLSFTACYSGFSTQARLALTLKFLGGLTTAGTARAFLSTEPSSAQRIVRAKRTLIETRIEFKRAAEMAQNAQDSELMLARAHKVR